MLGIFIELMERGFLPDRLIRLGIRKLLSDRLRTLRAAARDTDEALTAYAKNLQAGELAFATKEANRQHYEVPTEFFAAVLGAHRKYSCAYFDSPETSLDQAEEQALAKTVARAELEDGMKILELGCGWGSLSLFMARKFPNSQILAISNSTTQRLFIEEQARASGLNNLRVQTLDLSTNSAKQALPERTFDRVVSVEMFEHFRNYALLLKNVSDWLKPGGKLFVHIFTHREFAYPFETEGDDNWMGKYFFTGGQMPARALLPKFQDDLVLEVQWEWNGRHYQQTAEEWLKNADRHRKEILKTFEKTYASEAGRWFQRWRVFFLACSELFGFQEGEEWGVTHYLFSKPKN